MEKKDMCLSYVAVWSQPMTIMPQMDAKFCGELFGMPYETVNGLMPDGYTIAVNNKPYPLVVINPAKLIVKAQNIDSLVKYVEAVKAEIEKVEIPNFNMSLSAYGINFEKEILGLGENAEVWMWNRFIKNNVHPDSNFHLCGKLTLRIGVDENQVANIDVEPRMGVDDGIFVNINHHHNQNMDSIPNAAQLRGMIEASISRIEAQVVNKLFNE